MTVRDLTDVAFWHLLDQSLSQNMCCFSLHTNLTGSEGRDRGGLQSPKMIHTIRSNLQCSCTATKPIFPLECRNLSAKAGSGQQRLPRGPLAAGGAAVL